MTIKRHESKGILSKVVEANGFVFTAGITPDNTKDDVTGQTRQVTKEIDRLCAPDEAGAQLLKQAIARLNLSARAYHRVLKVARTLADLAGSKRVASAHIAEAIHYRRIAGTDF